MREILQLNTVINQDKTAMKLPGISCNISGMKIGERIRTVRERLGLSQSDIARKLGIRPQSVQAWESGSTSPRRSYIPGLCEILGVSKQWLEFGLEIESVPTSSEKGSNIAPTTIQFRPKSVPVISWVQAGQWNEVFDNHPVGQGEDQVTSTVKVGPHAFALKVRGDSMEPEFPDGSIIIVEPDREARHGSYVVVRLKEEMEATFKQLILDGDRKYLKPLNPRYPILEVNGKKATISGVVVQMVKEYG